MDTLRKVSELAGRDQSERSMEHEEAIWDHLQFVRTHLEETTNTTDFITALELVRSIEFVTKLLIPHYQFRQIDTSDYRAQLPWEIAAAEAEMLKSLLHRFGDDEFAVRAIQAEAFALSTRNQEVFIHGGEDPIKRLLKAVKRAV